MDQADEWLTHGKILAEGEEFISMEDKFLSQKRKPGAEP
jgi:hypothetical protein